MNLDKEYSWFSRKFAATILGVLVISGATILAQWVPAIVGLYPTFVGGIIGVLSLYLAGNVANKYVVSKTTSAIKQPPGTITVEMVEEDCDNDPKKDA